MSDLTARSSNDAIKQRRIGYLCELYVSLHGALTDVTRYRAIGQVTNHGEKLSASDGLTFDSKGVLYYGAFSANALVSWDPTLPLTPGNQNIVCQDDDTMQWQDTFAFDNAGNLYFTTNRLQLFFTVR